MKLRNAYLKAEWYAVVPAEELQVAYEMLWQIQHIDSDRTARMMQVDVFYSLTEILVERFSPPFQGGFELDNRRGLLR